MRTKPVGKNLITGHLLLLEMYCYISPAKAESHAKSARAKMTTRAPAFGLAAGGGGVSCRYKTPRVSPGKPNTSKAFFLSPQGLRRLCWSVARRKNGGENIRVPFGFATGRNYFCEKCYEMSASNTVSELVQTARQLSDGDFERFYEQIQRLHARKAVDEQQREADRLLKKLSTPLPRRVQMRWNYLIARRDSNTITAEEYAELLHLTEVVEKHDLMRLKWMAKLSEVSRIPLSQIPQHYGLQPR